MASCKPLAPEIAEEPLLAAKSAVAAAAPRPPLPPAPFPRACFPARPFLLPVVPLLAFAWLAGFDDEDGGSPDVPARFATFAGFVAPAPAKSLASSRSAEARPGAFWGAAEAAAAAEVAAEVAAVTGMASIAASRSAFLRHKNASVAGSNAGKRKLAVPTCIHQPHNVITSCIFICLAGCGKVTASSLLETRQWV